MSLQGAAAWLQVSVPVFVCDCVLPRVAWQFDLFFLHNHKDHIIQAE
jgi:hypothetical protein